MNDVLNKTKLKLITGIQGILSRYSRAMRWMGVVMCAEAEGWSDGFGEGRLAKEHGKCY